ncbi:ATP-binding cassette permease mdl1 [Dispira simplex]|nr:ATP-binding cassette permease mdl1 [Dispira simplex]
MSPALLQSPSRFQYLTWRSGSLLPYGTRWHSPNPRIPLVQGHFSRVSFHRLHTICSSLTPRCIDRSPSFTRASVLFHGTSGQPVRTFRFLAYFLPSRVPQGQRSGSTQATVSPDQAGSNGHGGHHQYHTPTEPGSVPSVATSITAEHNSTVTLRSTSPTPPSSLAQVTKKPNQGSVLPRFSWSSLRRLVTLARPEYKILGGAVSLLLLSSTVTMSVPFAMGRIIDIVSTTSTPPPFGLSPGQFFIALGAFFLSGALANAGRVYLIRLAGERVIRRLRTHLFSSLLRQEIGFFDQQRTGDLVSRLANDTTVVGKSLTHNISDGLRSLMMAGAGLSMMIYMSSTLTGIMLGIVPPISIAAIVYGRYIRHLSHQTQTALGESTKVVEERLSNIRTVQAFVTEDKEVGVYRERVDSVYQLAKTEAMYSAFFFGGAGLAGNLAIMAMLGVGGNMVMQGGLTVGELTSFLLYTAYVGGSLSGLTSFYSEIMKGMGASGRLFDLLDRSPMISRETSASSTVLFPLEGHVSFDCVSFAYPTRTQNEIFHDLSFTVAPGTVVGIAGASGTGKSTIAALLLRFYDPQLGTIRVDGVDLRELDLEWWRRQIAIVSQEPVLFAGTIAENVAYGLIGEVTESQIREALVQAHCGFVEQLPDGIHTYVGERGVSLSGGQKQRVAIARAIIKNPHILIFDEATSALDSENEHLMKEALSSLTRGRTVFTIAHRLSTLKSTNLILCLDQGELVETGTFSHLMDNPNGYFKRLMEYQMHH